VVIYSTIIFGAKPYVKVYSGHLSESWLSPSGRKLVGQAANLTFESARRLLYANHSFITICIIIQL